MADGTRIGKGSNGRGAQGPTDLSRESSSDREDARAPHASVSAHQRVEVQRSFPVIDPTVRAEPHGNVVEARGRRATLVGAASLLAFAVITVVAAQTLIVRVAVPLALIVVAGLVLSRGRKRAIAERAAREPLLESPTELLPTRALVLTNAALALHRTRGERTSLPSQLVIADRFGVTLLSNRQRDRIVAAITSDEGALLFATTVDVEGRKAMGELLARSTVVGGDDHALDATGPDGAPVFLDSADFRELVSVLGDRDKSCFERIVLTDQHGSPLILDGADLYVREQHFDLRRPLEWRSILFQEPFGTAVTLYQGTWIRQAGSEVVLVSLLSPTFFEGSAPDLERAGIPELDVMATRDQRLLQATATDPPPVEQRVAMDGLFVGPLRAVLDQAPRASSQIVRSGHP